MIENGSVLQYVQLCVRAVHHHGDSLEEREGRTHRSDMGEP